MLQSPAMADMHLSGLDHVVILVRDLDRAARSWESIGFTLAPRGLHSAAKGTANFTIILGPDYLELLGIVAETAMNAGDRAALARDGEGLDRAALRTDDAALGLAAARARGDRAEGPQSFERPVALPGGGTARAAFRTFEWAPETAPAGLRLFACEHQTPETVWLPELQDHANGARAILSVEAIAPDPENAARACAGLLAAEMVAAGEGVCAVPTGADRGRFLFLSPAAFAARYPAILLERCRARGAAALVLATADLETAARATGVAPDAAGRVVVPPERATGTVLVFQSDGPLRSAP